MSSIGFFRILFLVCVAGSPAVAADVSAVHFGTDVYASHTNLMPFKGYQEDLSAMVYAQYSDVPVLPFVRYVLSNYYYLNSTLPATTDYTSDQRTAAGVGVDLRINPYLRVRLLNEQVNNKLANQNFNQSSYGIIYNQYIDLQRFEINNYLESFYIPRISERLDTFFRIQALKSYYLSRSEDSSNVVYPLLQLKAKYNDDSIFGVSGHNISVGAGYKYFKKTAFDGLFSAVLEGHAVVYQSRDFNGDWFQALAAVQWLIK